MFASNWWALLVEAVSYMNHQDCCHTAVRQQSKACIFSSGSTMILLSSWVITFIAAAMPAKDDIHMLQQNYT